MSVCLFSQEKEEFVYLVCLGINFPSQKLQSAPLNNPAAGGWSKMMWLPDQSEMSPDFLEFFKRGQLFEEQNNDPGLNSDPGSWGRNALIQFQTFPALLKNRKQDCYWWFRKFVGWGRHELFWLLKVSMPEIVWEPLILCNSALTGTIFLHKYF